MQRETHKIDASGKVLGKLATEIAVLLRGKDKPNYALNIDMGDFVVVENADKVKLTGRKSEDKVYYHHTGYIGNLKKVSIKKVFAEKPGEILKKAVYGMLPKNKLRAIHIKRLKVK